MCCLKKCVVYKNKAMRGAWESEEHSRENQKNPLTTHHISKADNIKLMLKGLWMMPLIWNPG